MPNEKRKRQRHNVFLEALHCTKADNASSMIAINDISSEGIGVFLNEKVHAGDVVELELNVPKETTPVFVVGEVAWVSKNGNPDNTYRAGIRLAKISECDKHRLNKYLMRVLYVRK